MKRLFYAPKTYEEWGIFVPFEMNINIRVRKDGNKLECVIPGFSGNKGNYVFDWNGLPEQISLNEENMLIYSAITQLSDFTPTSILREKINLDYSGIFGDGKKKNAEDFYDNCEKALIHSNYALIMSLLSELGYDLTKLIHEGFFRKDSEEKLRKLVSILATQMKMEDHALHNSLEEYSKILSPVGVQPFQKHSHLRIIFSNLKDFVKNNTQKEETETIEAFNLKMTIIESAKETIFNAEKKFVFLDSLTKTPIKMIKHENVAKEKITETIKKIDFLLDGWPYILEKINEEDDKVKRLTELTKRLPIIPEEEREKITVNNGSMENKKVVKAGQNWLSN